MWFEESRLDDERALALADPALRHLAESGSRVRREHVTAAEAVEASVHDARQRERPRAVVAAGPDSRLLRAVLETRCPVPFVAWAWPGLPGWVGALDLVVILAPSGDDVVAASAVAEAVRRGCDVLVVAPPRSLVAEHAGGRDVLMLPVGTGDPLACAVVALDLLAAAGLGQPADAETVAGELDAVAIACSPHRDLAVNPAKAGAIGLADTVPMVWGGSMLAARAARRVAERLRRTTGWSIVAGDVDQLLPVVEATAPRDVFDDPFADGGAAARPSILLLDDGEDDARVAAQEERLRSAAAAADVRIERLRADQGSEVARYASLVLQGAYLAEYLRVGLRDD